MESNGGTPTITVPRDQLAEYAGRYQPGDAPCVVRAENGRLLFTLEEQSIAGQVVPSIPQPTVKDVPLTFIAGDLVCAGSSMFPFVRKPNGEIGWIVVGLRLMPRSR